MEGLYKMINVVYKLKLTLTHKYIQKQNRCRTDVFNNMMMPKKHYFLLFISIVFIGVNRL